MRRFWAVTRMTILECLRSKFAVVFAILLAGCVLSVGLTFEGDGTIRGRIQSFLDYSTTLTQLLLGLLTLLLAAFVTARDMRDKTVFTVASKPLPRPIYVAGRWCGIVILDAALLLAALGAIYALTQYLRTLPTRIEQDKAAGKVHPGAPDPDREAVDGEVFTARAIIKPDPFDVEDQVQQRLEQLFKETDKDQLIRDRIRKQLANQPGRTGPPDEKEVESLANNPNVRARILSQIEAGERRRQMDRRQVVPPGWEIALVFRGVRIPAGSRERLKLYYKLRPLTRPASRLLKSRWRIINPQQGEKRMWRDDPVDTGSWLEVEPQLVTPDHRLIVIYRNQPDNPTEVKIVPNDIKLLYRVGGFEGNLARAGLVILLRLMFLAAVGVLFGVWMSFPVACLTCLIILLLGCMGNFVQEATKLPRHTDPGVVDYVSYGLAKFAFFLLPNLPVVSSPADALRDGTVISWQELAREAATGSGLRALVALAVGGLIFWRREVARVQV